MDIETLINSVLRVMVVFYVLLVLVGASVAAVIIGWCWYLLTRLF